MSKHTRDKILYTATRLFYFQGFHGTGLNQIIKESGCPKGSLYHFFPEGKEQLAEEAIHLSKERIGNVIQHYMDRYENVEDALLAHVSAMADLFNQENGLEEHSFTMMPFGILAAESAFTKGRLREACGNTYRYWESIYLQKLLSNQYAEQDAYVISKTIIALLDGAVTLSLSQKSNEPLLIICKTIPNILKPNK